MPEPEPKTLDDWKRIAEARQAYTGALEKDIEQMREIVVQAASGICDVFHRLDNGLAVIAADIVTVIGDTVERANALTQQIATLNGQIQRTVAGGQSAPSLADARDLLIGQLGEMVNLTIYQTDFGMVSVSCAGTLLVDETHAMTLEVQEEGGQLVVGAADSVGHRMRILAGRLAAQ